MPELEVRRFKSLAVNRGVSVQEAVHQALVLWASEIRNASTDPLDALEGSLADVDVESLMQQEKETELGKDRRW